MSFRSFTPIQVLVLGVLAATSASSADLALVTSQINELDGLIEARPDEFAGMSVDEETKTVTLYHSNAGDPYRVRELVADLPRRFPRSAPPERGEGANGIRKEQSWSIKLKPVSRNHRALESVMHRMDKVEPWATMVKPVLTSWAIDVEQNVVVARVRSVTPALREAAARAFGSAIQLKVDAESFSFFSRSNDSAPWYGGIPIRGFNVLTNRNENCTAGFSVTSLDGAITGLLTAGHCFGPGQGVFQRSDGENVGGHIQHEFQTGGLDFGLIAFGDGYYRRVWLNETVHLRVNDPSSAGGVAFLSPQMGTIVCFNGSLTGERCNAKVVSLTACASDPRFFVSICGIVLTESTDGRRIAGGTDSGGPVYRKTSSSTLARVEPDGIITAGNESGTAALYTPIKKILTRLNNSSDLGVFGPWRVMK